MRDFPSMVPTSAARCPPAAKLEFAQPLPAPPLLPQARHAVPTALPSQNGVLGVLLSPVSWNPFTVEKLATVLIVTTMDPPAATVSW